MQMLQHTKDWWAISLALSSAKTPAIEAPKLTSQNSLLSRQTLYSKEFTKSDKIDDKIQDIDENIPNIDDPEAIRNLKSIGESKTLLKL